MNISMRLELFIKLGYNCFGILAVIAVVQYVAHYIFKQSFKFNDFTVIQHPIPTTSLLFYTHIICYSVMFLVSGCLLGLL